MFTTILATLAIQASAYSLCNPNQWRLKGQTVQNVPIVSSGTFVNSQGQSVTVAGSISVVDGCSFSVRGLTFTGVSSASWYGGVGTPGPTSPSVRLVNQFFNSTTTPINQDFTFITSAGAAVSFSDFDQFRLYDPISQLLIGTASIPSTGLSGATGSGSSTTGSAGSTNSTTTATTSSRASPTSTSSTTSGSDRLTCFSSIVVLAFAVVIMA